LLFRASELQPRRTSAKHQTAYSTFGKLKKKTIIIIIIIITIIMIMNLRSRGFRKLKERWTEDGRMR
jgi:uncharacterized membrane protein